MQHMIRFRKSTAALLIAAGLAMAFSSASNAAVQAVEKLLYSFTGGSNDGWSANGPLITDGRGNFYGTTGVGGDGVGCGSGTEGCGTMFKVARGKLSVIYAFKNVSDGYFPAGGLLFGNDGNLYGTTSAGGDADAGTVFKMTRSGVHTVLYSFTGGSDGASPRPDLAADGDGNIYGTASGGGNGNCSGGCGTIFKLTPEGAFTLLYSFIGSKSGDGANPDGLVAGVDGNFYGVTSRGGSSHTCPGGCGTVFKTTPDGAESVLYSFKGGTDGSVPVRQLLADNDGNLFGTTFEAGFHNGGTVFKVTPTGTETVLYSFRSGTDGKSPLGNLVADAQGNLYGTTEFGGDSPNFGTVFQVTPDGQETILYRFQGPPSDGFSPSSGLLLVGRGTFYGTTIRGGAADKGTLFRVTN